MRSAGDLVLLVDYGDEPLHIAEWAIGQPVPIDGTAPEIDPLRPRLEASWAAGTSTGSLGGILEIRLRADQPLTGTILLHRSSADVEACEVDAPLAFRRGREGPAGSIAVDVELEEGNLDRVFMVDGLCYGTGYEVDLRGLANDQGNRAIVTPRDGTHSPGLLHVATRGIRVEVRATLYWDQEEFGRPFLCPGASAHVPLQPGLLRTFAHVPARELGWMDVRERDWSSVGAFHVPEEYYTKLIYLDESTPPLPVIAPDAPDVLEFQLRTHDALMPSGDVTISAQPIVDFLHVCSRSDAVRVPLNQTVSVSEALRGIEISNGPARLVVRFRVVDR